MLLRDRISRCLSKEIEFNFALYAGLLVLYTICAATGSFTVIALPEELSYGAKNYLETGFDILAVQAPSILPVLMRALIANMLVFFCIALASVRKVFAFLGFAVFGICAIAAGFSSRILIIILGAEGAVLSVFCIWLIEIIFFLCRAKGIQLALKHNSADFNSGTRISFALCIAVSGIAVLCQCLLAPAFVKCIANFF